MRFLVMISPDDNEPFIGATAHRFGVDSSAPTDNWSAGGIAARIDPDSGELSAAVHAHGSTKEWVSHHPDSGAKIEGETVPNWVDIRELVLSASAELGDILPYIGWDIAVSKDGTPIIIEANRASDLNMLQSLEPLLADDKRRRFYEYHGVI